MALTIHRICNSAIYHKLVEHKMKVNKYKSELTNSILKQIKLTRNIMKEVNDESEYEMHKKDLQSFIERIKCPRCFEMCELLSDYTKLCKNKNCLAISSATAKEKHLNSIITNKISGEKENGI